MIIVSEETLIQKVKIVVGLSSISDTSSSASFSVLTQFFADFQGYDCILKFILVVTQLAQDNL